MSEKVTLLQRESRESLDEMDAEAPANPIFEKNGDLIRGVKVQLEVVLGEAQMSVAELFDLHEGSVVKLDRDVAAPIDIVIDGRRVARGTLVAVGDHFGVRISEIGS